GHRPPVPGDALGLGALVRPRGRRPARAPGAHRPSLADPPHGVALARHPAVRAQASGEAALTVSTRDKYAALADGFAEHEYADPVGYSARRAEVIAALGPPLERGDTVLDLCCADGIMAAPLAELGLVYSGVDATDAMIAAARRRNPGLEFTSGRMEDFEPPDPVELTICLRSFYLAEDRVAFFRRVCGYTRKKFVFDFRPVAFPVERVVSDLCAAGFARIELRPFFLPQRRALPGAVLPVLSALEHTGPLGLALTKRVGCVFCSAAV